MATWPVSLPIAPLQNAFASKMDDGVIQTSVDEAFSVLRRRSDATPIALNEAYRMTQAQKTALDTLFYTDTVSGAIPYGYTNPVTGEVEQKCFLAPPVTTRVSDEFLVTISVEVLP